MGIIAESIRDPNWKNITNRVEGWGINDSTLPVEILVDGKRVACPAYKDWTGMLYRALSPVHHKNSPEYKGTTICDEWQSFCNFYEWVMTQPCKDWQKMQLDKDFLSNGVKHYSPETCVYIPANLNSFILGSLKQRGKFKNGVCLSGGKRNPYMVKCRNPFTGKRVYLGVFSTEDEAHNAYRKYKHSLAMKYIEGGVDPRIEQVLLKMFT